MSAIALLSQGVLLGLSSGLSCLSSCAPVLLPLFLGRSETLGRSYGLMAQFLAARLMGYLAFAAISWSLGRLLAPSLATWPGLSAATSLGLGCIMIACGLRWLRTETTVAKPHSECLITPWSLKRRLSKWPALIPSALGLLSGLSVCAPFMVALTQGAMTQELGGSLLFFSAFFVGTSVFFLPLPLLGAFRKGPQLRIISAFAALLVGLYYLYSACLHTLAALPVT